MVLDHDNTLLIVLEESGRSMQWELQFSEEIVDPEPHDVLINFGNNDEFGFSRTTAHSGGYFRELSDKTLGLVNGVSIP